MKRVNRAGAPVFYPFLFAVFPVFSFLSSNLEAAPLRDAALPLVGMLAITSVAWLAGLVLTRDKHRRGALLLIFILGFYLICPIVDGLRAYFEYQQMLSAGYVASILVVALAITAWSRYYLRKTTRDFSGITRICNVVSVCVVLAPISVIAIWFARLERYDPDQASAADAVAVSADQFDGERPDIIYLVLDMYGRQDVIRDYFDFDNEPFVRALEDRGFYVAGNSYSNYNFTRSSIPSTLNFTYLDGLSDVHGGKFKSAQLVKDNRLMRNLRGRGYEVVSFATGVELTELRSADVYLRPQYAVGRFANMFIAKTPVRFLINRLNRRKESRFGRRFNQYDLHRDRVLYTLNQLKNVISSDKPRFIFAHVMSPHDPFVFDENARPLYPDVRYVLASFPKWEDPSYDEYVLGYRKQLQGLNRLVLKALDEVIERNPDTVILIQGDHGPRSNKMRGYPDGWRNSIHEEMAILNAYRIPGANAQQLFYSRVSPVNSFRIVLKELFGEPLELLPDEYHYVHWQAKKRYNVTEDLHKYLN